MPYIMYNISILLLLFWPNVSDNLRIRDDNRIKIFNLFLIAIALLGVGTLTTIYIISLSLKFDPMYFVLKDLQTLVAGNQEFLAEIFITGARLIFQACAFECGRTFTGMILLVCSIVEGTFYTRCSI